MSKQWYLLAYDIKEQKRLRKLHSLIKKEGIALQRSVFLIHANQKKCNAIIQLVKKHSKTYEDDVRLYPLTDPNTLWMAGQQQSALQGLYAGKPTGQKKGFITQLKHLFKRK